MEAPPARGLGEGRWAPSLAVLVFLVLNISVRIWLPNDRPVSLPWLLPVLEVSLLGVLLFSDLVGERRSTLLVRRLAILLVGLLVAAALWATVILISHLVAGDKLTEDGARLLASGGLVWLGNILAFGLLYWVLDSGGPRMRLRAGHPYPDFIFPQMQAPELA